MENARIHHSHEILELCDRFGKSGNPLRVDSVSQQHTGVRIEYLPPYSPDLNLIKEAFLKIKHFIWQHNMYYVAMQGDGILYDMMEVTDIITPDDAASYCANAGYF